MEFKLFYNGEVNSMQATDRKTVEEFIAGIQYAVLGSYSKESGARVSGISHFPEQNLEELCFATDSTSQKVKNLMETPVCELMYTDGNGQVILTGEMTVCTDPQTKRAKWMDHMIHHFPDGPDGNFCVLKFKPIAVRAMIL